MIRFHSPLPAETVARRLAEVDYTDGTTAYVGPTLTGRRFCFIDICPIGNHWISWDTTEAGAFCVDGVHMDPDRRARFLAVLAELGAEVLP